MAETSTTPDRGSAYSRPVTAEIDLPAAAAFMATHARVLDRRRFQLLTGDSDPSAVLAALDAYRNPDGGYDWLASVSLPDGGLPFALPVGNPAGCAPWWVRADPTRSSLQSTAVVTATAHRVATHDPAVAGHRWLTAATGYCLAAIQALGAAPPGDGTGPRGVAAGCRLRHPPEAAALLDRLGRHIPASGVLPVEGGAEEEAMRPLDVAPAPDRPARALLPPRPSPPSRSAWPTSSRATVAGGSTSPRPRPRRRWSGAVT
jgi:hypothetical protein